MSKLLLIDDEEGIRKVLSISLKSDGYEVVTAEDGRKGLDLYQKGGFSIVLTDLKMPELDGMEVLKKIKEINPAAEVIVITGHGDINSAMQSLRLGASNFITKGSGDQILSLALQRVERRLEMQQKLRDCSENLENMVREATEEIRKRYEFEGKLIQRWFDGIVAADKEGHILVFNPAAEKIFGYTQIEAKSTKKADDIYPRKVIEKIADIFSRKKGSKKDIFIEEDASVVGKNGETVPVRFSGAILYEGGNPVASVGFFQDLREIEKLQEELVSKDTPQE
jgi:two-component system NtrC family sensor kinase